MRTGRVLSWESHLIVRAAEGDPVAFELINDLYRPVLLSLAMRMLRDADDAGDAVQESMIKAFRAIGEFDPERPLKPWLCRICSNCCVDLVRNRKRGNEPLDQHEYMLQDSEDVDRQATGSIGSALVTEAVERLPEKYRTIIHMRHYRHMDVNEIAQELNKPEGTVKSWLFRARALLKKELTPALG
ncbi:MAG TPA: sigma-70 family RNA polymerase sigma factor [Fimbriimonas sp.]